jgi:hypothetical protein
MIVIVTRGRSAPSLVWEYDSYCNARAISIRFGVGSDSYCKGEGAQHQVWCGKMTVIVTQGRSALGFYSSEKMMLTRGCSAPGLVWEDGSYFNARALSTRFRERK